jgi:hypothetical protein
MLITLFLRQVLISLNAGLARRDSGDLALPSIIDATDRFGKEICFQSL